jgi:hypothetical protein
MIIIGKLARFMRHRHDLPITLRSWRVLIGAFLWLTVLCGRHYSCLLFSLRGLKDVAFGYAFITKKQSENKAIYLQYNK